MHVAILGLGEAGRRYAADLTALGTRVTGFDPAPTPTPEGTTRAESTADAVRDADLVISLTGAHFAAQVAEQAAPALRAGTAFADFNSTAPETKRAVARALEGTGAHVADVAVLAPVPRQGARTPLMISGPGAAATAELFRNAGAQVDVLDAEVGAAAGRKLLRSVFMKGLAATVLEAVTAGQAAGCEQWVREQIAGELGPDGPALVERLIDGTRAHAPRRAHEVRASRDYLAELGTRTSICEATLEWLDELAAESSSA